jgi:hypothetical protein
MLDKSICGRYCSVHKLGVGTTTLSTSTEFTTTNQARPTNQVNMETDKKKSSDREAIKTAEDGTPLLDS